MSRPTTAAACALVVAGFAIPGAKAATFTVFNTSDSGAGSLRQAILDANALPGADTIAFAIPGAGVQTISVPTPLTITDPVRIDGYSQPGSLVNTSPFGTNAVIQIELQGAGDDGLWISAGSDVSGLALYGFDSAILLTTATGNWIHGNFIGTDATGGPGSGNAVGISIQGTSGTDTIGGAALPDRNLISGNFLGIEVDGAGNKQILANLVGTGPSGSTPLGNGTGIRLTNSTYNQIGTTAARNLVSGNLGNGIEIVGGDHNTVDGNYIGTDTFAVTALGNLGHGVQISGVSDNFLVTRNVLSGNGGNGLELTFVTTGFIGVFNNVNFNFVGTDGGGNQPIGNAGAGIRVVAGGLLFIDSNVISHNSAGIWYTSPTENVTITWQGNSIYSNRGLGILLGPGPGPRANVPGTSFNFPRITSVVSAGGSTTIEGVYHGKAARNVTLRYFSNPPCRSRPREFDEGRTSIGTGATFLTDGNGDATFTDTLPVALTDEHVTAVAGVFSPGPPASEGLVPEGGSLGSYQMSAFSQGLAFSIEPSSGPAGAATPMYIHGTDFAAGATVTIGGLPANFVTVQSSTLITAASPALAAGTANDLEIVNTDGTRGTLPRGWISDFSDVPDGDPIHDFVVTLFGNGITGGVGGGLYGPAQSTLRQQMAVFLLKGKHGVCYVPPSCTGVFSDVPCPSTFADWIEALAAEGITGGCGAGVYCPQNPVRRDQMAVFLLKAKYGAGYAPPTCTGVFGDVPCPSSFASWIEQLAAENITGGCGGGNYCPGSHVTRGQMAVFVTKTFELP